jgi:pyridoxal phosphate enzyme (YggS family)
MTSDRSQQLIQNRAALLTELQGTQAQLLIVSKTQSADDIRILYQAGHRDFGENRVQELEEKEALLSDCSELRWHLIGHLQSNKIPKLNKISRLYAIHSVDTAELAEKLARSLQGHHSGVGLFLQFNTSQEDEKSGFEDYSELYAVAKKLIDIRNVRLQGLMTMATIRTKNPEAEAQRCFQDLQELGLKLQKSLGLSTLELSMGMSNDYAIALKHGTNWVRVGSKIFQT